MGYSHIEETIDRVLRERDPKETAESASARLMGILDELGFPHFLAKEDAGGLGGDWSTAYAIFSALGRWAAPVVLGEEMLASYLMGEAQQRATERAVVCFQSDIAIDQRGTATGWARNIPALRDATRSFLAEAKQDGQRVLIQMPIKAAVSERIHSNLADETRADVWFDGATPISITPMHDDEPDMIYWGAVLRSCQMAGAMQQMLSLVVEHVKNRKQFGRELSSFQAVQHQVATLCSETAAVSCAAEVACKSAASKVILDIASAKLRANMAVEAATAISHQMLGAVGFTQEHSLNRYTRRLWAWRSECGSDRYWSLVIGKRAADAGSAGFWNMLTAASDRGVGIRSPD